MPARRPAKYVRWWSGERERDRRKERRVAAPDREREAPRSRPRRAPRPGAGTARRRAPRRPTPRNAAERNAATRPREWRPGRSTRSRPVLTRYRQRCARYGAGKRAAAVTHARRRGRGRTRAPRSKRPAHEVRVLADVAEATRRSRRATRRSRGARRGCRARRRAATGPGLPGGSTRAPARRCRSRASREEGRRGARHTGRRAGPGPARPAISAVRRGRARRRRASPARPPRRRPGTRRAAPRFARPRRCAAGRDSRRRPRPSATGSTRPSVVGRLRRARRGLRMAARPPGASSRAQALGQQRAHAVGSDEDGDGAGIHIGTDELVRPRGGPCPVSRLV